MQLNELIEKEGLESVSEKTNISLDNLNRLINEDFEGLNRVKALGFLSILQREYGIDIGALDASIRSYFEEHTPNGDEPLLVSIDKSNSGGGLFKWIVILAFLGGVWYLYSTGKLDKLLSKNADTQKSSISDTEILKSNISDDKAKESVIIKKEANETKVEIKTAPETVVAKEKDIKELNQTEENKTQVTTQNSEDKVKITADIPKDKNDTKDENKTILVSKDAGIEEPQKVSEVIDSDSTTEEADKNQTITNITINPTRGMLWYGFINIDTGKKKEFMKNESTPFELNGGRWILTTGHGFLDIVSDVKTIEVSDRVRHYFYIDSKEIKEISRAEFKKLNHGRMW